MKNKLFVIPLALCMLLVTSCDSSDSSSSASLTSDNVAYSEILSSKDSLVQNIKSAEYDNITINEDFVLELPQSIGNPSVAVIDHFQDNYQKMADHYLPAGTYNSEYYLPEDYEAYQGKVSYPTGPIYDDKETGYYVSPGCTGYFQFAKSYPVGTFISAEAGNQPKRYCVLEEYSDDKLTLGTSEMTVSQTVELAQKFSDEFCELTDYPPCLEVEYADVVYYEDLTFMKLSYRYKMDDTPVFSAPAHFFQLDEKYQFPSAVAYVANGEVLYFCTNELFEVYNKGDDVKIIAPDNAVELVSDFLAERIGLDLKRMSLMYMLERNDPISLEVREDGKKTHRELAPWAVFASYDAFVARPVWVLYFDEEDEKEIYALYDNLSGEIMFVNNKTAG